MSHCLLGKLPGIKQPQGQTLMPSRPLSTFIEGTRGAKCRPRAPAPRGWAWLGGRALSAQPFGSRINDHPLHIATAARPPAASSCCCWSNSSVPAKSLPGRPLPPAAAAGGATSGLPGASFKRLRIKEERLKLLPPIPPPHPPPELAAFPDPDVAQIITLGPRAWTVHPSPACKSTLTRVL